MHQMALEDCIGIGIGIPTFSRSPIPVFLRVRPNLNSGLGANVSRNLVPAAAIEAQRLQEASVLLGAPFFPRLRYRVALASMGLCCTLGGCITARSTPLRRHYPVCALLAQGGQLSCRFASDTPVVTRGTAWQPSCPVH